MSNPERFEPHGGRVSLWLSGGGNSPEDISETLGVARRQVVRRGGVWGVKVAHEMPCPLLDTADARFDMAALLRPLKTVLGDKADRLAQLSGCEARLEIVIEATGGSETASPVLAFGAGDLDFIAGGGLPCAIDVRTAAAKPAGAEITQLVPSRPRPVDIRELVSA